MCNENEKWSINDYISGVSSICREERQYALYLSNVLRYYGSQEYKKALDDNPNLTKPITIFAQCGLDFDQTIIENVFYEATFMRDIFVRNRDNNFKKKKFANKKSWMWKNTSDVLIKDTSAFSASFNYNLLAYCWKIHFNNKEKSIFNELFQIKIESDKKFKFEEKNYGARNEIPTSILSFLPEKKGAFKTTVRAMMNAKPDIAIVYRNGDSKSKLLFIECKFKSDEDCYYYNDNNDNNQRIYQTEAQGYIADFLCKKDSYLPDLEVSDIMRNNNNKSKLIRFIDAKNCKEKVQEDQDNNVGRIGIADLIRLEQRIFEVKSLEEKI